MPRSIEDLIAAIRDFEPEDGSWLALDGLLGELFQAGAGTQGIDAMLAVFERHPTEDGVGVFWSIVHGLESLPSYEPSLVESVRRAPAELSLVMIGRMLNAGVTEAGGVQLRSLVREVAGNQDIAPEIRRAAQKTLERHTS
jgi:hypothetical protein